MYATISMCWKYPQTTSVCTFIHSRGSPPIPKGVFRKVPPPGNIDDEFTDKLWPAFDPPTPEFFQNSSILQGRGFSILAFTLYTEKSKHRAFLNNNVLLCNKDLLYFAPWSSLFRHFGFVFCVFLQMLFHQSTLVHSLILRVGLSWPTMRCYYYSAAKIHCVQFLLHRWSSDANKPGNKYIWTFCVWFDLRKTWKGLKYSLQSFSENSWWTGIAMYWLKRFLVQNYIELYWKRLLLAIK